jgi:hypothetical protein
MRRFNLFAFIGFWFFAFPAHAQFGMNVTASADGNGNLALGNGALANEIGTESDGDDCFTAQEHIYACGKDNAALAPVVLSVNTTGSYNTGTGYQALASNKTGNYNSASGYQALYENVSGAQNAAYGAYALRGTGAGNYNTASGVYSLFGNTTGSYNIGLGYKAGFSVTTGSNNIDIGSPGVAGDTAVIRIGTVAADKSTQTAVYIAGANALITANPDFTVPLYANSFSGQLGTPPSSERFKTAVEPMGASTEKLEELRPVTFRYKGAPNGTLHYGLIAEEVARVYPELVIRDAQGKIMSVRYDELAPMLLNELHKQKQLNDSLIAQVRELQSAVFPHREHVDATH